MKLVDIKTYKKNKRKKDNKKYKIIAIAIFIMLFIGVILYNFNSSFKLFFDKYIFRKEVEENNLIKIELNANDKSSIYAYNKYISILKNNTLEIYDNLGKKETTLNIEISNPLYSKNGKFLSIAEKEKNKIYLISGTNIVWQNTVEGQIVRLDVNQNGYVSIVVSGTSYKSVVITYNPEGKELFKKYLATTYATNTTISNDNKYLAIAEVNSSGALVQSNIKIVSMSDPKDSITQTYKKEAGELILKIKYDEKNKLLCMYDNKIEVIDNNEEILLVNFKEKNAIFADINLEKDAVYMQKDSGGIFKTNTHINIVNINSKKTEVVDIEGLAKSVYTDKNVIAVNLGTIVHFIGQNGWTLKRYTSSQEIKDIILSDNLAGIIYKDKIEIINL